MYKFLRCTNHTMARITTKVHFRSSLLRLIVGSQAINDTSVTYLHNFAVARRENEDEFVNSQVSVVIAD